MHRATRYSGIIPLNLLHSRPVSVIGCGAIGRSVALLLAQMGSRLFTIWDPDTVSAENLGPQGFSPQDLGQPKVGALQGDLIWAGDDPQDPSTHLQIRAYQELFDPRQPTHLSTLDGSVVFCCVDSITTRAMIFEALSASPHGVPLLLDGRMASLSLQLYTISLENRAHLAFYRDTLFPQREALDVPCTERSTTFCATLCASLMLLQFSRHLRHCANPTLAAPPPSITMTLLSGEYYEEDPTTEPKGELEQALISSLTEVRDALKTAPA